MAKLGEHAYIPSVTWLWAISKSLRGCGIAPLHFVPNAGRLLLLYVLLYIVLVPRAVLGRSATQWQPETNRMNKGVHHPIEEGRKLILGFQGSQQMPAEILQNRRKKPIDRWRSGWITETMRTKGTWTCAEGGGGGLQARLGKAELKERWSLESELGWMESNRKPQAQGGSCLQLQSLAFSSMAYYLPSDYYRSIAIWQTSTRMWASIINQGMRRQRGDHRRKRDRRAGNNDQRNHRKVAAAKLGPKCRMGRCQETMNWVQRESSVMQF